MKRCGFVALIGAPNAGKSTLLNALMGTKISIVCHKSQTTRCRVAGIHTKENTQLVLLDTPGIFVNPKSRLDKAMVEAAWQAAIEADIILMIVDASRLSFKEDIDLILKRIKSEQKRPLLVLNKVDMVADKTKLLTRAKEFFDTGVFEKVFMISAKKKSGLEDLEQYLLHHVPSSEWLYPEDQIADLSERIIAAEFTRESLMHNLHREIPYGVTVETDLWERFKNKSLKIIQTIVVEKEGYKRIVLGKGGQKIKVIGLQARRDIEAFLGTKVHLILHVRVDARWKDKPYIYQELGLNFIR